MRHIEHKIIKEYREDGAWVYDFIPY